MSVCVTYAFLVPVDTRESIGYPRTGFIDDFKLSHGCWESNLSPWEIAHCSSLPNHPADPA